MFIKFSKLEDEGTAGLVRVLFKQLLQKNDKEWMKVLLNLLENGVSCGKRTIKIRTSVHSCGHRNLYLIMVKCALDAVTIQLAHKYGFPRGFPVLIDLSEGTIQTFGFYPKFDNDSRAERIETSELSRAVRLQFFKKWSGFLLQVIAFKYKGKYYWTCCSKNSANGESSFLKGGYRLLSSKMTPSVVQTLAERQILLCGEAMMFDDQCHGARVLREEFVVTAVGVGHHSQNDTSHYEKSVFVNFFPPEEVSAFAASLGFAVDTLVTVEGRETVMNFMKKFIQRRDFLTDTGLQQLLHECGVVFRPGTVTHQEVLGNVLEGLVMMITNEDGTTFTKKVKLPVYTSRTFGLRKVISSAQKNAGDARVGYESDIQKLKNTISQMEKGLKHGDNPTLCKKIGQFNAVLQFKQSRFEKGDFVKIYIEDILSNEREMFKLMGHWTVSEEGHVFWTNFLRQCFERYLADAYDKYSRVAPHIQIADSVLIEMRDERLMF